LNPPWQITLQKNTQPVNPQPKLDNYETWLTFPENATLTVRSPQPGDWIAPLGMHGQHQKIGDLFTNAKVPRRARAHWPLVLVNDEVAWVVGLKTSETFRVKSDSVSVLHLKGLKTDLEN
jgi:tRNA(Ile)-lysidine synthase